MFSTYWLWKIQMMKFNSLNRLWTKRIRECMINKQGKMLVTRCKNMDNNLLSKNLLIRTNLRKTTEEDSMIDNLEQENRPLETDTKEALGRAMKQKMYKLIKKRFLKRKKKFKKSNSRRLLQSNLKLNRLMNTCKRRTNKWIWKTKMSRQIQKEPRARRAKIYWEILKLKRNSRRKNIRKRIS